MPCYVTGSAAGDAELAASEARTEATKVTRLLCEVMEMLEKHHREIGIPLEVHEWWEKHKRIDAKRREDELKAKKRKEIERAVEAYRKKLEKE